MKDEAIWNLDFRVLDNVGEGKEAFIHVSFSLKSKSFPVLKKAQELTRQTMIGFKANIENLLNSGNEWIKEEGKWKYESALADKLEDGGELSVIVAFGLKNKTSPEIKKVEGIMHQTLVGFMENIKQLLGEEVRQSSIKFTEVWEF